MSWTIDAMSTHGAYLVLMKDIPTHDDAKDILEQILKQVAQRRTRMVSLEDIVFDPACIMAYSLRERQDWVAEDIEEDDAPLEITLDKPGLTSSGVSVTAPGAPSGVTYALPDTPDTIPCTRDVDP